MTENTDYTFLTNISQTERIKLLTLLENCQQLQTISGRESVIQLLNLNLRNSLNFAATSSPIMDISRLFDHCLRFPNGWNEFMVSLHHFEGKGSSIAFQAIQEYLQELGTRYTQSLPPPNASITVLDQPIRVPPGVPRELQALNLESTEPALFRPAAEAMLRNRLQHDLTPMQTGGFISDYITHAEYQLFLDDMLTRNNQYWQPDFWTTFRFKQNLATTPLVGLDKWAAEGFCKWLTAFDERGYVCRLPTAAEAINNPANNPSLATWCVDNSIHKLIGLTSEIQQQFLTKLAILPRKPLGFSRPATSTLSFDLATVRNLNHDLMLALTPSNAKDNRSDRFDFHILAVELETKNFNESLREIRKLHTSSDPAIRRRAVLLNSLIEAFIVYKEGNVFDGRLASQHYVIQFTEYVYMGLELQESTTKLNISGKKQVVVDLYFWARMQIERRENGFPAWEGLRVVREPR